MGLCDLIILSFPAALKKVDQFTAILAFVYRDRRWVAEVKRHAIKDKLSYQIVYYPKDARYLKGNVEIVPPMAYYNRSIWKQHRRHANENLLHLEFINVIGHHITEWMKKSEV